MAKEKPESPKSDPVDVVVTYSIHPYYAVSSDAARLTGIMGFGKTLQEALENLRFQVNAKYPKDTFKIIEKIDSSKNHRWSANETNEV